MPWLIAIGGLGVVAAFLAWSDSSSSSSSSSGPGQSAQGASGGFVMTRPNGPPEIPANPGYSDETWARALSAVLRGLSLGAALVELRDSFGGAAEDFGSYLENASRDLTAAYAEAASSLAAEGLVPPDAVGNVIASQKRRQRRRETWGAVVGLVGAAVAAIVGAVASPVAGAIVAGGAELAAGFLLADWTEDADQIIADVGAQAYSTAQQWIEENPEAAAYILGAEVVADDPDEANQLADDAASNMT